MSFLLKKRKKISVALIQCIKYNIVNLGGTYVFFHNFLMYFSLLCIKCQFSFWFGMRPFEPIFAQVVN